MSDRNERDQDLTGKLHKYTVGEISQMLGIPAATIRFYDASGAVTPQRDKDNRYRRYTVVDANYLVKMKELRNVGVQVSQAAQLLNSADLEGYAHNWEQILSEAQARIDRETRLLGGLHRQLDRLNALPQDLNTFSLCTRPALWRYNNQVEDRFFSGEEHDAARRLWTDWMPLAHLSFRFRHMDAPPLEWGYLLEDEYVSGTGLDQCPYSEFYPSAVCVRYVFSTEGEIFLRREKLQPAITFLENHRFFVAGDILGRSICRVLNQKKEIVHYYEAWIPIGE